MRVRPANGPVPQECIEERPDSFFGRLTGMGSSNQLCDVFGPRAAVRLVFLPRLRAQRLAHVFLVDAATPQARASPVVACDDNGGHVREVRDTTPGCRQASECHRRETEMLIEIVLVKARDRGLENVTGRVSATW